MRIAVSIAVMLAAAVPVLTAAEEAPIPKEGSYTTATMGSATLKALPLGKERVQLSWEWLGVQSVEGGKGLTHDASARCQGSLRALNGEYESYTNSCVFTRLDGDQLFWVETMAAGRMGGESRGTGTIVGGTGKLAGITGSGEWTRRVVRPAAEGTFQTVQSTKMTYRLP